VSPPRILDRAELSPACPAAPFDAAAARRLAHDHAATLPPDALPVLLALLAACDALEAASPVAPLATPDPYATVRQAALALADALEAGVVVPDAARALHVTVGALGPADLVGLPYLAPDPSAAAVRAWAASLVA
jgi:hypothetical protein